MDIIVFRYVFLTEAGARHFGTQGEIIYIYGVPFHSRPPQPTHNKIKPYSSALGIA
jgi:hypothetical protein